MKTVKILLTMAIVLLINQSYAKSNAQKAKEQNLAAVTVFVDITAISRKKHAAKKMTKLHQEYAQQGFELISLSPYTENGDLEGFFVSYRIKDKHE